MVAGVTRVPVAGDRVSESSGVGRDGLKPGDVTGWEISACV